MHENSPWHISVLDKCQPLLTKVGMITPFDLTNLIIWNVLSNFQFNLQFLVGWTYFHTIIDYSNLFCCELPIGSPEIFPAIISPAIFLLVMFLLIWNFSQVSNIIWHLIISFGSWQAIFYIYRIIIIIPLMHWALLHARHYYILSTYVDSQHFFK